MWRVHLALALVQLAFATLPVAGKLVMEELPPYALAWVRVLAGAVVFGVLAAPRIRALPWSELAKIAGCGLLGMAANQVLFLGGLERTSAIHATVLVATIPVFAFIFALLARKEKAGWLGAIGVAVALMGVLVLAEFEQLDWSDGSLVGDLMIVCNAAAYGVYLVAVKPLVERHGPLVVVAVAFMAAAVAVAPFGVGDVGALATLSPKGWALLSYIILAPTLGTYLLNGWALSQAPSSLVAVYIYLQPIGGAALAVVVLGETLGPRVAVATAAVLLGITAVNRARLRAPPEETG